MNYQELTDLVARIKEEPSVLFLGQNYLSSFSGQNDLYNIINQEFCGGTMPSDSNYANLWEHLNEGKPLQDNDFAKIRTAEQKLPTMRWLRNLLFMRWGMIMTSAVDTCLFTCTGTNIDIQRIPLKNKQFRREYMSKAMLHCSCLYNSVDGHSGQYPPAACDPKTLRGLKKQASDRVSWIFDSILSDYGVLVIDGWDPRTDWAEYLLSNAGDMPFGSIYLFGATEEMAEDETISGLIEDGILILEKRSFAQVLNEYAFFDEDDDQYDDFGNESGKTITIKSKKGRIAYINIPDTAFDSLDSRITVFHDDLGKSIPRSENRGELFAQFLRQTPLPAWGLHSAKAGFHFARRIDSELREAVDKQLRKNSTYQRSMIILEGVSNSGKSAALIHLAMELRDQHICPVIFISGKPSQSSYLDNLKRFLKVHLLNRQDADGAWVENIVVIWDGNTASGAISEYERLYNELSECNILLVASSFKHMYSDLPGKSKGGVVYCPIDARLQEDEIQNMERLIKGIDSDLWQRFQQAKERFKEPNLLTLLQHIAKYCYSDEWKGVAAALKARFEHEMGESIKSIDGAAKRFVENNPVLEEDVLDAIRQKGVGAAWQLQLENYLERLRQSQKTDFASSKESDIDEDPEVKRLRQLQAHLRTINDSIALAGQFSLPLPLSLLLRLMRLDNSAIVSQEALFIRECLANDSLVEYYSDEQGYYWVRFRHPSEAILYVERNFGKDGDDPTIQDQEIQLLCDIISSCRWDSDEAWDVIALVRCFGPNSAGKYNESISDGHYERYMDNLLTVADTLYEEAYENNEAAHVYAHFLREKYVYDKKSGLTDIDLLRKARRTLKDALERHDRPDSAQYGRLQGELCANIVVSMPEDRDEGKFDKDLFRSFQKEFDAARNIYIPHRFEMRRASFSSNALLDIWLNAAAKFRKSFPDYDNALKDDEFVCAISDSVAFIDDLLDIDDHFSSDKLLGNVEEVYSLASSEKIKTVGERLAKNNNDTYLYLNARKGWLTDVPYSSRSDNTLQLYKHNLLLVPDDADHRYFDDMTLKELRESAVCAAEKVISILEGEENRELINRAESSRCLYMLIRAKWLLYTSRFPLEEKQRPTLSRNQWKELSDLCEEYYGYCIRNDVRPKVAPLLINAVYKWSYGGDIRRSLDLFDRLRQQWRGKDWFVERIGLCLPGKTQMMIFHVDIVRTAANKYRAKICYVSSGVQALYGRYNIYVSDSVLEYLFDGQLPRERYNINKPVVIWFNAEGPALGRPIREEGES